MLDGSSSVTPCSRLLPVLSLAAAKHAVAQPAGLHAAGFPPRVLLSQERRIASRKRFKSSAPLAGFGARNVFSLFFFLHRSPLTSPPLPTAAEPLWDPRLGGISLLKLKLIITPFAPACFISSPPLFPLKPDCFSSPHC